MGLSDSVGKLGSYLLGEGLTALKGNVDEKMDEVKIRAEIAAKHAVKKLALVLTALLGAIFVLVGVAMYLSETVSGFDSGIGFVFVGAFVLFIAIVGRIFSAN